MDDAAKAALVGRLFQNNTDTSNDQDFGRLAYEAYLDARGVLDEGAKAKEHQNPDWVRRCVASVVNDGSTKGTKAPAGTDREDTSRAFAICHAQHKKLSSSQKSGAKQDKKKWGKRMKQYDSILKAARRKK